MSKISSIVKAILISNLCDLTLRFVQKTATKKENGDVALLTLGKKN